VNKHKPNDIIFEAMLRQGVIDNFYDELSALASDNEVALRNNFSKSHEKRMRAMFAKDELETSLKLAAKWAKKAAAVIIVIAALAFGALMTFPEIRAAAFEIFAEWLRRYIDPKDFSIDGDVIYLLESTGDRVVRYNDGGITEIELDAPARKITGRMGAFYVLYNDLSITRHDLNGKIRFILDETINEAVSGFVAIGEYLYITVADIEGENTYKITLKYDTGIADILESFRGRILSEDIVYESRFILEEGLSIGRQVEIIVRNVKTDEEDVIIVSSLALPFGAQYLGKDNQGNHWVKTVESITNEDNSSGVVRNIIKVLPDGSKKFVRSLGEQERYIINQVKVFDGQVYELRILGKTVEVVRLMPQ